MGEELSIMDDESLAIFLLQIGTLMFLAQIIWKLYEV